MMDERLAEGLEAKLPLEEKEKLVECYPCVTLRTIGQWESNYANGGARTAPRKEWDAVELAQQRLLFQNQLDYADYAVLEARSIASFHDTGVAQIFTKTMDENKRKALVIFYCSTKAQVEDLKTERNLLFAENSILKRKIDTITINLGKYKKAIQHFKSEITDLKTEVNNLNNVIITLKEINMNKNTTCQNLQKELNAKQEEIARLEIIVSEITEYDSDDFMDCE